MNRLLMIGSLVGLMAASTGCLHHNTRATSNSCSTGNCGDCSSCSTGSGGGILGKLRGSTGCSNCGGSGCRNGCVAGPLGWQQGGMDYSSHLNPGLLGHNASAAVSSQPYQPGPQSAQIGYPYYTHRGPRDFLMDNPPSIGR